MKIIRVKEHGTIKVGSGDNELNDFDLLLLDKYNIKKKVKMFHVGRNRVIFKHYVGVIQVGNVLIEVLPKVNIKNDNDDDKLQAVLIDMLRTCKVIKARHSDTASILTKKTSLLDFIYSSFVEEVSGILHIGMAKKYRRICSNVKAFKGRMVFSKNVKHNLIHKERFFTEHQTYDYDNIWNRFLKGALQIVCNTASTKSVISKSKTLLMDFDSVSDINIDNMSMHEEHYERGNIHYKNSIEIAKLIITNSMPNVMAGRNDTIALLFNMNALFEEYVYRCVLRAKSKNAYFANYAIRKQNSINWVKDESYSLRADILIQDEKGETVVILDTKWKTLKSSKVSVHDLRQMYTYNMQYGSKNSILLYPNSINSTNGIESLEFEQPKLIKKEVSHSCRIAFFKLFNENNDKLNRDSGNHILELIKEMKQL